MIGKYIAKVAVFALAGWAKSKGKTWVTRRAYGRVHGWLKGVVRPLEIAQLDFRVIFVGAEYDGAKARYFSALQSGQVGLPESVFVTTMDSGETISFFYNPEKIRVERVVQFIRELDVELEIIVSR